MNKEDLIARLLTRGNPHPSNVGVPVEWVDLIDELDRDLVALARDYEISQVKVKFGGLRFYAQPPVASATAVHTAFQDRVARAEREAGYL